MTSMVFGKDALHKIIVVIAASSIGKIVCFNGFTIIICSLKLKEADLMTIQGSQVSLLE